MALIAGFPNISGSAAPSHSDLNTAVQKIAEQIGGVTGDGTSRAGNLDSANFAAGAGFRNEQKLEPRSVFAVTVRSDAGIAEFNLPIDAEMLSFGLCTDGTAVLQTYTVHLWVDEEEVRTIDSTGALPAANTSIVWVEKRPIGAGTQVKVTLDSASTGSLDGVAYTFMFAAPHRRV